MPGLAHAPAGWRSSSDEATSSPSLRQGPEACPGWCRWPSSACSASSSACSASYRGERAGREALERAAAAGGADGGHSLCLHPGILATRLPHHLR